MRFERGHDRLEVAFYNRKKWSADLHGYRISTKRGYRTWYPLLLQRTRISERIKFVNCHRFGKCDRTGHRTIVSKVIVR